MGSEMTMMMGNYDGMKSGVSRERRGSRVCSMPITDLVPYWRPSCALGSPLGTILGRLGRCYGAPPRRPNAGEREAPMGPRESQPFAEGWDSRIK
eukprot:9479556-Pyramimonas_sp.AAC.1